MAGPGTELTKLLSWFVHDSQCSNCADKAKIMDEKGPDWVEQEIETVTRWVVDNAQRQWVSRLIPESITSAAAKLLILEACKRSRSAPETTKSESENITGEHNESTETNTADTSGDSATGV